jgi:LPXTG-motif cell wall-anchored protein
VNLQAPAGLNPGDHFRIIFVTPGATTATSSNIADYDNFVNAQAGGAMYNGVVLTWLAVGSTSSVDAITHIGANSDPVFLANGTRVANTSDLNGLWSGMLINPINMDLASVTHNVNIWSGTTGSGMRDPTVQLGSASRADIGSSPSFRDADWISIITAPVGARENMYGISGELTVAAPAAPAAAPEPSSATLIGLALIGLASYFGRRRRSAARQCQA